MRLRWVTVALLGWGVVWGFQAEERAKRLESGRMLLQHRNWKAAANEFERVLKESPKDPEAQTGLGIALWEMGSREAGLAAVKTAIRLKPGYEEAELALGFMIPGDLLGRNGGRVIGDEHRVITPFEQVEHDAGVLAEPAARSGTW